MWLLDYYLRCTRMLSEPLRSIKPKIHAAFNSHDRRAKIQDGDFIMGLLQATCGTTKSFSLSALRLSMCSFLGTTIGSSAFNERMATASLTKQLRHTLAVLMEEAHSRQRAHLNNELLDKLGVSSIVGVEFFELTLARIGRFFSGNIYYCFFKASSRCGSVKRHS